MTKKVFPIHVLYESELQKYISAGIENLQRNIDLKDFPFSADEVTIKLGYICLGTFSDTISFQSSSPNQNSPIRINVDFGSALKRILSDYQLLMNIGELLEPEILFFSKNDPTDKGEWQDQWKELVDTYKARFFIRSVSSKIASNSMVNYQRKFPEAVARADVKQATSIPQEFETYKKLLTTRIKFIKIVSLQKQVSNQQVYNSIAGAEKKMPSSSSSTYSTVANNKALLPSPAPETIQSSETQPVEPRKEAPPKPIVLKPVQPAEWQIKDPPVELVDRFTHTYIDTRDAGGEWYVCGASRRGKLHENEGTFREDAFAIEYAAGWILIAVADGAGSHHLSRVGSNLAVKSAIEEMQKRIEGEPPSSSLAEIALGKALRQAWIALYQETERRKDQKVEFRDLSTTLLLLMYHPKQNLLGAAQVGDGLIAAQLELEGGQIIPLGSPESGEYSGQTYFLTNHKSEELASKCGAAKASGPIRYLFVMTDGVSDDFYPPQERLPGLIKAIPPVMASEYPDKALLDLINYNRSGSFDDRTLVIICKRDEIKAQASKEEKLPATAPEQPKTQSQAGLLEVTKPAEETQSIESSTESPSEQVGEQVEESQQSQLTTDVKSIDETKPVDDHKIKPDTGESARGE